METAICYIYTPIYQMLRVANGLDNAALDGTGADAKNISAADAIKKFTPSLGIPYLGV